MEPTTPTNLPPHKRSKRNQSFSDRMCESSGGGESGSPSSVEDEEGKEAVDSLNLSAIAISSMEYKPYANSVEEFLENPSTLRPREEHLTQLIDVSPF